jgi:hypothetical protein
MPIGVLAFGYGVGDFICFVRMCAGERQEQVSGHCLIGSCERAVEIDLVDDGDAAFG